MRGEGLLTLGSWLGERARVTPERVAIDFGGALTTYGELDRQARALAAALHGRGLRHGDRLATLTGNRPEHVAAFFACARAGLVLCPLNWRLAPAELAVQLDDAEPALLLVEREHESLAEAALALARVRPDRVSIEEDPGEDHGDVPPSAVADGDPLLLVYTSGSTGRPKGALLTHTNCFWTNLGFDLAAGVSAEDVVLATLPQFHVGGWNVHTLLAVWKGATLVLERSFEPARALDLIERKCVTTMMGVPATYLFLAQQPGFAEADLSSLRRAVVGGAPMPEALLATWAARGVAIVQGYGLTEAAPNVLCLPPEDAERKRGCAGKPYPYVEVALRDVASGRHVEGAGRGELLVRGPNVFAGYWRNDAATAEVLVDGWLVTGDVADRDEEGYLRISGRLKEMYISGGENVYPAEIETVLAAIPGVAEAAVVAVPDARWGEAGIAFVALERGAALTEAELLDHLRERLASYKVPRSVRFLPELPRSGVGKVLRGELQASLERELVAP
ncbi:MAG: AMP-binding protein [Actinobacteria bacterium]|nr:AMP-binding protein [Actinomycetota bacterium]